MSSCKLSPKEIKWNQYINNSINDTPKCIARYYINHPNVSKSTLPVIKLKLPPPPKGELGIRIKLWQMLLICILSILIVIFFYYIRT